MRLAPLGGPPARERVKAPTPPLPHRRQGSDFQCRGIPPPLTTSTASPLCAKPLRWGFSPTLHRIVVSGTGKKRTLRSEPVVLAATVAAFVSALLAICAAATIWIRSAPKRLVAECREAQECAERAEKAASRATVEVASVRGAWLVQQQDIEKYLDSIDSRAHRISAVESQKKKAREREEQNAPEDGDPEALMAALRADQGI